MPTSRVRLRGAEKFGTKAEVKNLNSFRFLKQALDYEIARQVALLEGGGRMHQETRLYNTETGETAGMRSKEDAHDYRYFPEPDLVPLRISDEWLEGVRASMPELPAATRALHRELRAARIRRRRCSLRRALWRSISKQVARGLGRSEDGRQLGHGRPGGRAEGRGQRDRGIAGRAANLGELVALIAKGESDRQAGQGHLSPKMFESRRSRRRSSSSAKG